MGGSTEVQAPQPSAEERELQQIQINQIREQEAEQAQLRPFQLQSLGLIEEDGALRRITEEERIGGLTESQRETEDIAGLQRDRQLLALKGEIPLTESFRQSKRDQFERFKEAQARQGNFITGDNPEDATGTGTAGIEALRQFKERFGILEEAQRRGEIQSGTANLLATQSGITGVRQQNIQNQIAFPQRRSGFLSSIGQAFQPFQFNRNQQFQANQQNAQNQGGFLSDIGSLAGTLLTSPLGGTLLGKAGSSALNFAKNLF